MKYRATLFLLTMSFAATASAGEFRFHHEGSSNEHGTGSLYSASYGPNSENKGHVTGGAAATGTLYVAGQWGGKKGSYEVNSEFTIEAPVPGASASHQFSADFSKPGHPQGKASTKFNGGGSVTADGYVNDTREPCTKDYCPKPAGTKYKPNCNTTYCVPTVTTYYTVPCRPARRYICR